MEKREAGWCDHLRVSGFYKPGGSTAFRIDCDGRIYTWWINNETMLIVCEECWDKENPITGPAQDLVRRSV